MGLHSIAFDPESVFPTVKKETHFGLTQWDIVPLKNEKRFQKAFRNLSFDLAILVERAKSNQSYLNSFHSADETCSEDIVTFKSTSNFGSNLIPLTPWIICHRLYHAGEFQNRKNIIEATTKTALVLQDFFDNAGVDLTVRGDTLGLTALLPRGYDFRYTKPQEITRRNRAMLVSVMTMRSARENLITNEVDVMSEFFAQYCIEGSVKLRLRPDMKEIDTAPYEARINAVLGEYGKTLLGRVWTF